MTVAVNVGEALLFCMLPSQARAIQGAYDVHKKEVVRETLDSSERVKLRNALQADMKCHAYRAIARIAQMSEEVEVNPVLIVEQLVFEDDPALAGEANRDIHNLCSLRGIISQGLQWQNQYYLPIALPAKQ